MRLNRKILFFSVTVVGALLFLGGGLMIVSQSGLARVEKQSYYSKRAKQKGDILVRRLANYLEGAGGYTNTAKLSEIFTAKSLNLNEFPEGFRTGVKRIRITDSTGAVIFSTMGTLDNGNILSPQVTSLAQQGKFTVFTPNRDTFAALTKYEDPLNLQQKGYILFEFNTTGIFQEGLGEVEPVVRVENGIPLLVIKDNPQATYQQIASFDLYRPSQDRAPLTGLILSIPYMGNIVYYMGDSFYFPPWLSLLVAMGCFLIIGAMYFYLKEQGGFSAYASGKASEVKNLISDINKGKSYPKEDSFTAIDKTSKYGSFPEDDLDRFDLASNLNEAATSDAALTKEESTAAGLERKEFVFESLDDEDFPFDPENIPSLEELHQEDEYTLPSDEELHSISDEYLLEEENLDPKKDAVEDAFENIPAEEDPNEEGNASLAMLMDFQENPQEADPPDKSPLERYEEHLDTIQGTFWISRRARAHNNQGLFLLEDESVFGPLFQITAEDPIFQELLSEGKVLSLSGSLEESQYITSLIAPEVLETLSDLFIVPILDDAKSVSDIIVLGRDKGQEPLTVEDKRHLFSY